MPATLEQKLAFRKAVMPIFKQIQEQFGIEPKIALVQSALESNWGLSQLATEGLNIFSITPGGLWVQAMNKMVDMHTVPTWTVNDHATVYYPTTEYSKHAPEHIHYWDFPGDIVSKKPDGKGGSICVVNRYFRKYISWEESSWDWARKISKTPIYSYAYQLARAGDLNKYALEMHAIGYATDASYETALMNEGEAINALPPEATV
jgi:flagellum-specific peptidoglycan hydrolase FlgJ